MANYIEILEMNEKETSTVREIKKKKGDDQHRLI